MTIRTILLSQWPACALLALLSLLVHLRVRRSSAVKSVLSVFLFGIALVLSITLICLGIQAELWTLQTLLPLGAWSWCGIAFFALVLLLYLIRRVERKIERRRHFKAMRRVETQHAEELSRARAEGAAEERERMEMASRSAEDVSASTDVPQK